MGVFLTVTYLVLYHLAVGLMALWLGARRLLGRVADTALALFVGLLVAARGPAVLLDTYLVAVAVLTAVWMLTLALRAVRWGVEG